MSTLFSTEQASATTFSKAAVQQQVIGQYHVKPVNSRNNTPNQPRHWQRLQALALCVSLALGMGMASSAHAGCSFSSFDHCLKEVGNFIEDEIIEPIGKTVLSTGQKIGQFSETQFNNAKDLVEDGLEEVEDLAKDIGNKLSVYESEARSHLDKVKEPLVNMVSVWKSLANDHKDALRELRRAVRSRDASKINKALESNLEILFTYAGFNAILEDFESRNAGSLLLIFSGGAGTGVTAGVDVGLAIDVDFLRVAYDAYESYVDIPGIVLADVLPDALANALEADTFKGSIASLFTAGGLQLGPAASAGVDLVVGYHVADPNGVNGPGLDLGMEFKTAVGGSIGVGWDLSKFPWQIVTAGIGIGSGAGLKAAIGPSYAVILGQLCHDGSFGPKSDYCLIDSTGGVPIRARKNTSKCMHKKRDNEDNGNPIHLWGSCGNSDNPNRGWFYEEATGYIRLAWNPTKCLVKEGRGDDWGNGKIAHLWDCDGGTQENKKWTYEKSTGYIRSRHNRNACLHKKRNNWLNGNNIHIWRCDQGSSENKTWDIDTNL